MPESLDHHIDIERKIINLMLNYKDVLDEMLNDGLTQDFFDPVHHNIVYTIYDEYLSSDYKRLLERDAYRQILLDRGLKGDMMLHLSVWDKCAMLFSMSPNELGILKKKLSNNYVARKSHGYLEQFREEAKTKGYFSASTNLVDRLQAALTLSERQQMTFTSLDESKEEQIRHLELLRNNPEISIKCGIPEIDDPMNVGFKRQHMTLFVANVGHHKTNVMLNVALNIYNKGHSILFVPLEMTKEDLINRIIANQARVNFSKLARPELLSDDDLEKIKKAEMWDAHEHKFCILDVDERISVSTIQREIKKRAAVFKPKVVIIDYIANLKPDSRFSNRNDLAIGEILKTLRFLGKKYGFHIVSAAQLGREAIKALREGKENAADSTSIRGSHEYAADADNIFILMKVPGEEDKLKVINIKARHGASGFSNELHVDAAHCLISSTDATLSLTSQSDIEFEINTPVSVIEEEVHQHEHSQHSLDFSSSNLDDDIDDLLGQHGTSDISK